MKSSRAALPKGFKDGRASTDRFHVLQEVDGTTTSIGGTF